VASRRSALCNRFLAPMQAYLRAITH
jgi:hypothetical protein